MDYYQKIKMFTTFQIKVGKGYDDTLPDYYFKYGIYKSEDFWNKSIEAHSIIKSSKHKSYLSHRKTKLIDQPNISIEKRNVCNT